MNGFNVSVASEVAIIKSEYFGDSVDSHRCGQSRIVHLHAGNVVFDEQATPFRMYCQSVGKQQQSPLEGFRPTVCFVRRETTFRSEGRVQVFQNSATFCDVRRISPKRRVGSLGDLGGPI